MKYYLTVATCIKGENDYIDDFIKIHDKLGVEAYIFYDRDGENLTNKFADRKNITVVKYPEPLRHHESHKYTVENFQGHSRWIAFIDCDQVLYSPINEDLKITLKEYEKYAQLQPVWHSFGDAGQTKKTEGSVYERFTKRGKDEIGINDHTQSVCDISRMKPVVPHDPHRLMPMSGELSVDENHRVVGSGSDQGTPHISPHTQNKIFVAHYISKSKEEWDYKNSKMRSDTGTQMDPTLFESHSKILNEVEDTRIAEFWRKHCT